LKADLHIHSIYSHDSIAKPESVLAAAADRGIEIIAITDHNTTAGWKDFLEQARHFSVQVIPGQEIKIYNSRNESVGELLCLFLKEPIENKNIESVIQEVKAQGGLVSIAHPFSERRGEFRAYTDITDWRSMAVEVMNGRTYTRRDDEMARAMAEKLNTMITAGSDAHTPFEVGSVYLEFSGKTITDLKKAILNHEVEAKGHSSNPLFSLISGFGRIGLAI